MARVLIIDDEDSVCKLLMSMIRSLGHEAAFALTLTEGVREALGSPWDMVFLDVHLPDGSGLNVLSHIRRGPGAPEVVILTGVGTGEGAEMAIRGGAWDYILKPFSRAEIELSLRRVLQYREGKAGPSFFRPFRREGILGDSPEISASLQLAAKAAAGDANVLITGETGTGKELFARAIHENSSRREKPFVVVDCAALPESLVESILLGHAKGAFTGADRPREGLIRQAHGGTLFLDEVGELSLDNQKKFLRALQEGSFRPLGGTKEVTSDFRLVAATNRSIDAEVDQKTFRKDLLYRLRTMAIELAPLRERDRDIQIIAFAAVRGHCRRLGLQDMGFCPEFLESLNRYHWPGNVRELVGAMEAAVAHAVVEQVLHPVHLPADIRVHLARSSVEKRPGMESSPEKRDGESPFYSSFTEHMDAAEKKYFQNLALFTNTNVREMQKISDLSRAQVYRLLRKHRLKNHK